MGNMRVRETSIEAYMQCNESVNYITFSANHSKMTVFCGGRELKTLFKGLSIHKNLVFIILQHFSTYFSYGCHVYQS